MKLQKIVEKSKKRIGRGHGSGKVKTAGRGTKGQKARGTIPPGFEGGQLALVKRLPLLRGKGKLASLQAKTFPVSVAKLAEMPAGSDVTLETLKKYHMIDASCGRVKILGTAKLSAKLTVHVPCSTSATQAIEAAGGTVVSA
jgi:large subunit ribosomal protein L15